MNIEVNEYWSSEGETNRGEYRGGNMHRFRDLKVYEKALEFTRFIRKVTSLFPKEETYGLVSQFRRAADSIVLNIAEGAGHSTSKEFSRFLDYSIRSGFECIGCADISVRNGYIIERTYLEIIERANELVAMLYGLKKSHRS